jgi:hypothetical protein
MAYGTILADVYQSSTAGTPPVFNDGSGNQVGTLCRAWVAYSTATVSASFNVSSITANATGDYTINFTTAMPDTNYASVGNFGDTTNAALATGVIGMSTLAKNTGSVRITQQSPGGVGQAGNRCSVAIFR